MVGIEEIIVRDTLGRVLELNPEKLGEGGQGIVYRVRDSRLAVKIVQTSKWRGAEENGLSERLRSIQRLPLDGLPLAHPVSFLVEPHVGYVMELLEGVTALRWLMYGEGQEDVAEWYRRTGGLRRRLRLLTKVAWVLAALHGRGIVYGDPSPDNILVSQRVDREEVWLIDIDNLALETGSSWKIAGVPGYGAPELKAATSRLSTLSDAFAFAVLAFETLTANHPFVGDQVHDGDSDLLKLARDYRLPWIYHSGDDSNRSSYYISRDIVIGQRLGRLFSATFEAGLRSPSQRPGMSTWLDELVHAAEMTRVCAACEHTCYVDARRCPWCGGALQPVVIARAWIRTPACDFLEEADDGEAARTVTLDTRDALVLEKDVRTPISARMGSVTGGLGSRGPMAWAQWDGSSGLLLHNAGRRPLLLMSPDGRSRRRLDPGRDTSIHIQRGAPAWRLHCTEDPASTYRLLTFDMLTWD